MLIDDFYRRLTAPSQTVPDRRVSNHHWKTLSTEDSPSLEIDNLSNRPLRMALLGECNCYFEAHERHRGPTADLGINALAARMVIFAPLRPDEGHVEVICQTQTFRLGSRSCNSISFCAQPSRSRGIECFTCRRQRSGCSLVSNRHARRYILRLSADGSARVTVPRGGSRKAALDFAQRNVTWIEQQLQKRHAQKNEIAGWRHGSEIFFRGRRVALAVGNGVVEFADQVLPIKEPSDDLRRSSSNTAHGPALN